MHNESGAFTNWVANPSIQPMIAEGWGTTVVQLLVSAGFASLVVQLLLVRQNRRKIEGEASTSEANAASVLSGEALKWVERANNNERAAKREAHNSRQEAERYFAEWNLSRWRESWFQARISVLEAALSQGGIAVPAAPEMVVPLYLKVPEPKPLPPDLLDPPPTPPAA